MKESGFYLLKEQYIDLIHRLGGMYADKKERPIYCCIQDQTVAGLYWAIPTSDLKHRSPAQIDKITRFCALPQNDIRSAYYHVGTTNRPAIFRVSNALPITDSYIDAEYISQGIHLMMRNKEQIDEIHKKLLRILSYEGRVPNRFEQHITDIKIFLTAELAKDSPLEPSAQEKTKSSVLNKLHSSAPPTNFSTPER